MHRPKRRSASKWCTVESTCHRASKEWFVLICSFSFPKLAPERGKNRLKPTCLLPFANVLRLLATEPPGTQRSREIARRVFKSVLLRSSGIWTAAPSDVAFCQSPDWPKKSEKHVVIWCYMMLYDVTCGSCAVCFKFLHIFSINFLVSSVASWGWAAGPLVFPNASRLLMEVPFPDVPRWIDMNRYESMRVDVEWCERELCAV